MKKLIFCIAISFNQFSFAEYMTYKGAIITESAHNKYREPYTRVCPNEDNTTCRAYLPTVQAYGNKIKVPSSARPQRARNTNSKTDRLKVFKILNTEVYVGDVVEIKGDVVFESRTNTYFDRVDSIKILNRQPRFTCKSIDNRMPKLDIYFIRHSYTSAAELGFKTFMRIDDRSNSHIWIGGKFELKGMERSSHNYLTGKHKFGSLYFMHPYWNKLFNGYGLYPSPKPKWKMELNAPGHSPTTKMTWVSTLTIEIELPNYGRLKRVERIFECKNIFN